jgi:glycine hydroxymethyltransferase
MARAGLLACGIGLPIAPLDGDINGLRFGVPEIVRLGMKPAHMDELASLIVRALGDQPETVARDVEAFRHRFRELHFIN